MLVYRCGAAVESVLESSMREHETPVLVVESDEATARELVERKTRWSTAAARMRLLAAGQLERARALVANGRDDENAAVILGARQAGFSGEIIALVEEPMHRQPLSLAGASAVFTPRHVSAAALAARASARISARRFGHPAARPKLEVREMRVRQGSSLAGKTLAEAAIGARAGATVIGQWVGGKLHRAAHRGHAARAARHPGGGGQPREPRPARRLLAGAAALPRDGPYRDRRLRRGGTQGGASCSATRASRCAPSIASPMPGVDLVGNVLDPELLERAEPAAARAVVVALDSDDLTLFTTVVVKDLAPEVPVIARVNQLANLEKIHRAGADFALSISQVAGQILARRLLGQEAVSLDPLLKVQRVPSEGLVGHAPAELAIRDSAPAPRWWRSSAARRWWSSWGRTSASRPATGSTPAAAKRPCGGSPRSSGRGAPPTPARAAVRWRPVS